MILLNQYITHKLIIAETGVRFLIDFGSNNGGRLTPSPWNNFSNTDIGIAPTSKLTSLITTDSNASGLDLEVIAQLEIVIVLPMELHQLCNYRIVILLKRIISHSLHLGVLQVRSLNLQLVE